VYPTGDELAAALGAELRSFVLLLDAAEPSGFLRDWQPREAGPMRHYGYAFQWFAMAVTVAGILGWRFLRRPRRAP
ncbi:MAG: SURF1 family cytochrome oxidase biogenesis protein, partial [Woeseiaceae bacterium]